VSLHINWQLHSSVTALIVDVVVFGAAYDDGTLCVCMMQYVVWGFCDHERVG